MYLLRFSPGQATSQPALRWHRATWPMSSSRFAFWLPLVNFFVRTAKSYTRQRWNPWASHLAGSESKGHAIQSVISLRHRRMSFWAKRSVAKNSFLASLMGYEERCFAALSMTRPTFSARLMTYSSVNQPRRLVNGAEGKADARRSHLARGQSNRMTIATKFWRFPHSDWSNRRRSSSSPHPSPHPPPALRTSPRPAVPYSRTTGLYARLVGLGRLVRIDRARAYEFPVCR